VDTRQENSVRILIVDDEFGLLDQLRNTLESLNYTVDAFADVTFLVRVFTMNMHQQSLPESFREKLMVQEATPNSQLHTPHS